MQRRCVLDCLIARSLSGLAMHWHNCAIDLPSSHRNGHFEIIFVTSRNVLSPPDGHFAAGNCGEMQGTAGNYGELHFPAFPRFSPLFPAFPRRISSPQFPAFPCFSSLPIFSLHFPELGSPQFPAFPCTEPSCHAQTKNVTSQNFLPRRHRI